MAIPVLAIAAAVAIGAFALAGRKKKANGANGKARYDWEPVLADLEGNIRQHVPNVGVTRLTSGYKQNEYGEPCFWTLAAVDPPIEQGAYVGIVRCPETTSGYTGGEFWADTVASAKKQALDSI